MGNALRLLFGLFSFSKFLSVLYFSFSRFVFVPNSSYNFLLYSFFRQFKFLFDLRRCRRRCQSGRGECSPSTLLSRLGRCSTLEGAQSWRPGWVARRWVRRWAMENPPEPSNCVKTIITCLEVENISFKNRPIPASFIICFWSFQTNIISIFTSNICAKMSIQYTVLEFEHTTFGIWVSLPLDQGYRPIYLMSLSALSNFPQHTNYATLPISDE